MKTFIYKLSLFALLAQIGHANQAQKLLTATADASVRKDRQYENYGDARHITVTKDSAKNARVALLKFDTADVATEATKALLRIYIADVDGVSEERTVLIRSVNDNFDEDHVTWDNYDVHEESAGWIEFHVHNEHVGMLGQVDVSMLMVPGENLNLAIHTSDKGHVKFASKENEDASAHPKLLLLKELAMLLITFKRNREEDTDTTDITANANNDAIVAQLVEQNNSLTMEKNHLERMVESLQFEKEMRDVNELNSALLKREKDLSDNRTLLDRIEELESKNHHLNHKVIKLEKDNSFLDGKVGGLKALLGHRNDTIAGLLDLSP